MISSRVIIFLLIVLIAISGYATYFIHKEADVLKTNPCDVCEERMEEICTSASSVINTGFYLGVNNT